MIWSLVAVAWSCLLVGFVLGCAWHRRTPDVEPPAFPPSKMLVDVHVLDEMYWRGQADARAEIEDAILTMEKML